MCGIFAYFGEKTHSPKLVIEGLKKLEYRGYDSWGIAYKKDGDIAIHKEIGKIGDVHNIEELKDESKIAIGHSRWATHGGVTQKNAHPHFSENKEIVLVHNGILENYLELKKNLEKKGHTFRSQTDTEVIAHLIEDYTRTHSFFDSVKMAMAEMEGRYAIVVMKKDEDALIAARRGSPLILGVGKKHGEYFVASDIPAFLKYTNKVIYLDDNQICTLKNGSTHFFDTIKKTDVQKRIIEIDWDIESAEKGEFPHFMIKEITEQKDTLTRAINQDPETIKQVAKKIESAESVFLVGCGTAGKACMVGQYLFSKISNKQVSFAFGSEFENYKNFINKKSLIIAVSQSGETADTLEAMEIAKGNGAKIVSIVNVENSSMARMSDFVIPVKAGQEKAVASTKATTSQIAILMLLAYACDGEINIGKQLLVNAASQINDMLNPRYEEHISKIAEKIKHVESMYIIGRGENYPIALESAIKLQEVSYIHAEGFAGGELKHGPLALISKDTPVIALVANDEQKKNIISNTIEVKARGGFIIGVSPENQEVFDYWIRVPDVGEASPIVNIIPVQLLAYKLAVLRHVDPDKPRNLAKSVTVK
ncbi:MAG: glutamine--fructose-6-phosphate transaminase (isomerizing) [Candidatus Peregrinibacteria bacterium]|nr:glutamine--fructose-6-phosphate transaminase (isomerizing) [Candidatus Peregrinibacteria bacterium]